MNDDSDKNLASYFFIIAFSVIGLIASASVIVGIVGCTVGCTVGCK